MWGPVSKSFDDRLGVSHKQVLKVLLIKSNQSLICIWAQIMINFNQGHQVIRVQYWTIPWLFIGYWYLAQTFTPFQKICYNFWEKVLSPFFLWTLNYLFHMFWDLIDEIKWHIQRQLMSLIWVFVDLSGTYLAHSPNISQL